MSNPKLVVSYADRTIQNADMAYNILRNTWQENRLDCLQNFSMLLSDDLCRTIGLIDFPLNTKAISYNDAQRMITAAIQKEAQSFVLAQNRAKGIIKVSEADLCFINCLLDIGGQNEIVILDYLLINHHGFYSYMEEEFHLRNHILQL